MKKGMVDRFIFPGLLLVAVGVFGFRYWYAKNNCSAICQKKDGEIKFNAKAFDENILHRHPEILATPFHLVVFLDLDHDCKSCLFEASYWVAPKEKSDNYQVTFFMPRNTAQDTLKFFQTRHEIKDHEIVLFTPDSIPAKFHSMGVLKVFVSQKQGGIEWFEFGNSTEEQYREFYKRVMKYLESTNTVE